MAALPLVFEAGYLSAGELFGVSAVATEELWRRAYTKASHSCRQGGFSRITDRVLVKFAKECTLLTHLDLRQTPGFASSSASSRISAVTDEGIIAVADNCRRLEKLYLKQCSRITDKALMAVAQGCPNLTIMDLNMCTHISDQGVVALALACPKLHSVGQFSCGIVY
jgi:hypothetical protein